MTEIEGKIYKVLYEKYKSLHNTIFNKILTSLEYKKDPEEYKKVLELLVDFKKWDYNGIQSKEDQKIMEEFDKLISK